MVKYSEECFGRPRVWGACNVVVVGLLAIPEILEFFFCFVLGVFLRALTYISRHKCF